jgi:hypothetical protein
MENGILIEYEIRDDRMYFDLKTKNGEHIPHHELLSVITGALGMVIRMAGEKGHRTEGEIFRGVMNHLTNEFVNPDSFKDLEVKR